MIRLLPIVLVALVIATSWGCGARRMAPFAPHRPDSDFHRSATTNQACVGCHEVAALRGGHQASDDCHKCYRILHGDL